MPSAMATPTGIGVGTIVVLTINGLVGIFLAATIPTQGGLSEVSVVLAIVELMGIWGLLFVWVSQTRINTANSAPEGRLAYLERVHHEHESIYRAIRDRDAESARAAMRTHLTNSRERQRRSQPLETAANAA